MSNNLKSAIKALKKRSQQTQPTQTVDPVSLEEREIKLKEYIKLKKEGVGIPSAKTPKVHEKDYNKILTEMADKAHEAKDEFSRWSSAYGSAPIRLDEACRIARKIAHKAVRDLKEKSFFKK